MTMMQEEMWVNFEGELFLVPCNVGDRISGVVTSVLHAQELSGLEQDLSDLKDQGFNESDDGVIQIKASIKKMQANLGEKRVLRDYEIYSRSGNHHLTTRLTSDLITASSEKREALLISKPSELWHYS